MHEGQTKNPYNWLETAKSLQKTFVDPSINESISAQKWEDLGLYYWLASRQSNNIKQFQKISQKTAEAYQNAAELFRKRQNNFGKTSFCLAAGQYAKSWNEPKITHKQEILENCIELLRKSKQAFVEKREKTNYGKACNLSLPAFLDLEQILLTTEERKKVLQEGIENATEAISIFTKYTQNEDLIFAFSYAAVLTYYLKDATGQYTERNDLAKQSLSFSRKALQLSIHVNNPYSKALANWAMATASDFLIEKAGEGIAEEHSKLMAEQALIIRDRVLIGMAYNLIANFSYKGVQEETDANKRKERLQKAIRFSQKAASMLKAVNCNQEIAASYFLSSESYSSMARDFRISCKQKLDVLKKAIKNGENGQKYASLSGSPNQVFNILHTLSKVLFNSSTLEKSKETKTSLLQRALFFRKESNAILEKALSKNTWLKGMGLIYQAQTELELANLESTTNAKLARINTAIANFEMGITNCKRWNTYRSESFYLTWTATYEHWLANAFEEHYALTQNKDSLEKANEVYKDMIENFEKAELPSRAAETNWKIASNLDSIGNYSESSENFQEAKRQFEKATKAIPEFETFYLNLATHMNALQETEAAKQAHQNGNYAESVKHYRKTSKLLKKIKTDKYLPANVSAWAKLEQAEYLSSQEQNQKAIETLNEAIKLFEIAKGMAKTEADKVDESDKKQMAIAIIYESELRKQYCKGRIQIEKARLLDKKGDHLSSSEKYGASARTFQAILEEQQSVQIKTEICFLIVLAKAWQKMNQAEHESKPILYNKASELFERAQTLTQNQRIKMLILGNSRLCKALEASGQFFDTLENPQYETALKELLSARNYFTRAGNEIASEHLKAIELFLTAFLNIINGKKETDLNKKERYYLIAEQLLEAASISFAKAGYPEKRNQVQKILEDATAEKKLCISLSKTLNASQVAGNPSFFNIQNNGFEKVLGLTQFEDANIQARMSLPREALLGEEFEVQLDLVNVARKPAQLTRIESFFPRELKILYAPNHFAPKNNFLETKGMHLQPLKVESLVFKLVAEDIGDFRINPIFTYADEKGKLRKYTPDPTHIIINQPLKLEFRITYAQETYDYLLNAFIEDYMQRRLSLEWSGWRTLMEINRGAKVSKHSLYGKGNKKGKVLTELERRGLVERRIFRGERGRGGEISKIRIYYDREIVKRLIDRKVAT